MRKTETGGYSRPLVYVAWATMMLAFPVCAWVIFASLQFATEHAPDAALSRSLRFRMWIVPLAFLARILVAMPAAMSLRSPYIYTLSSAVAAITTVIFAEAVIVLGRAWQATEATSTIAPLTAAC